MSVAKHDDNTLSNSAQLDRVIHLVVALNRALRDSGEHIAVEAGLTHSRRMVLQTAATQPQSVADIARQLGLARQGVQRVADELEADALIAYQPNPHHRRAKLVICTPAGSRALTRISKLHADWTTTLAAQTAGTDWPVVQEALATLLEHCRPDSATPS